MPLRRTLILGALSGAATGCGLHPELVSAHSKLVKLAAEEGVLRIDATTEQFNNKALLGAFTALYPGIRLEYTRPSSRDQYTGFMEGIRAGRAPTDILISSAMDLQFKLVNDGYAQSYTSPEKAALPDWAVWKDQAYAVTAEPIVFGYNKRLMPPGDVPQSHAELADLLRRKPDFYRGKVATYDPELSGSGYLYYTQDLLLSRDTLDLAEALGPTKPQLYSSGQDIIIRLSKGEFLFGYNVLSSYLLDQLTHDPNLGIVFPSDYTLVTSRIAIIPKGAQHPAAAKLFLDFLLSAEGQTILASLHIHPVRNGVAIPHPAAHPEALRPIQFGPALLANLDGFRRERVLREWRRSFAS
jgi:iron(III) transport system substrate-binding protein